MPTLKPKERVTYDPSIKMYYYLNMQITVDELQALDIEVDLKTARGRKNFKQMIKVLYGGEL